MKLRRTFEGRGYMRNKVKITVFFRMAVLLGSVFAAVVVNLIEPANTLAANLVWQTSKQAAVTLAQQQHRMILLVAGRDT